MQIAFKSGCQVVIVQGYGSKVALTSLQRDARPIIIAPLVTLHLLSSHKWGYCWPRNDLHSWHFHSRAASDIELGALVQLLDERCHVHCRQRDFASFPELSSPCTVHFTSFFMKAFAPPTNCLLLINAIEKVANLSRISLKLYWQD